MARQYHILVVEDQERWREDIFREALEDEGYQVVTSSSYDEAVAALDRQVFDLVVIDINLTNVADNPGFSHYAIEVDDLDKAAEELKQKGYEMDGPTVNKDTKRQILTVRDPNGFLVQFVQYE